VIATLEEEDIFGEVCLFSGKTRSATMLTEDYVNLLVLKRESFLVIIQ
jgi:CRP-like cAMP-binding protein